MNMISHPAIRMNSDNIFIATNQLVIVANLVPRISSDDVYLAGFSISER